VDFHKASSLRIGSSTAWVTETPGATAGFLEFTGQGLETFERARDERLLAMLGSRVLEGQKKVGDGAVDRTPTERGEQYPGQHRGERQRVADVQDSVVQALDDAGDAIDRATQKLKVGLAPTLAGVQGSAGVRKPAPL
jgi:hypothetical protein